VLLRCNGRQDIKPKTTPFMVASPRLLPVIFGLSFAGPFVVLTASLALFVGKERALRVTGKLITLVAASILSAFIPQCGAGEDFSLFRSRIKRRFFRFCMFNNVELFDETEDKIEFRVRFCPVASSFRMLGMAELGKYSCAADWVVAKANRRFWTFRRDKSIGTGFAICNHTYIRNESPVP